MAEARDNVGVACQVIAERVSGPARDLALALASSHARVAGEIRAGAMTTSLDYDLPTSPTAIEHLAAELAGEAEEMRITHAGLLIMATATDAVIERVELTHGYTLALATALMRTAAHEGD